MDVSLFLTRTEEGKQTSIYAHIRYSGFKFKYYLTEKIDPAFWNLKEQQAKKTNRFPGYMEFNRRLEKIRDKIKDLHNAYRNNHGGHQPRPDEFKEIIDKELRGTPRDEHKPFVAFFEDIKDACIKGTRVQPKTGRPFSKNTIKAYHTVINQLKAYEQTRRRKLEFEDINVEFHADFTEFLITRFKLGSNSVGKAFKDIKMAMNEALERGLHKNLQHKSRRFTVTKEPINSIYLRQVELSEMMALDLSGNPRLEKVRDTFIIGCHTGLRFGDLGAVRPEHIKDGYIKIVQAKTDKEVVIPVHPEVSRILEKYGGRLPKALSNQKTNEYLKEIGQQCTSLGATITKTFTKGGLKVQKDFHKWEMLSSHTQRRTFATLEYLAGTSTETIMAITGHRSQAAFKGYLRLTPTEHAEKMKQIWATRNQLKAI